MKGARLIARIFAIIYILSLLPTGVLAQALPGRVATTPSSSMAVTSMNSIGSTSDLLFGKGTTGPYTLSWKPIDIFSETVTVDGRSVQRDLDYDINYVTGAITFREPVSSDRAIRISYSYDPSKAIQNEAPMSVPLKIDLLKKENAGLQFNALYKQSAQSGTSDPGMMVYGLTGNTKLKAGEINSMFMFSPDQPGQDGDDDSSFGDRAAISFGGTTKMDKFQLSTSYMRVGEQFEGAKDFNLQKGIEAMDLAATFMASPTLSISSSMKRTENLAGEKKGEANTTIANSMVFTPNDKSKLTISRTEVEKESQGAESTLVTNQIIVDANPSKNLSLQSRLIQKDSSQDGEETGIGLNIDLTPTKALSVKAAINRVDSEKTGDLNTETLRLVVNPGSNLNIDVNLAHKDSDITGDEFAHSVRVISAPVSNVQMELGLTGQSRDLPGDESLRMAKLSTSVLKNTTVQVNWSDRDSELKGAEEIGGVRVETSPIKAVKLTGAVGQRDTTDTREVSKEARIELSPFDHTRLGGGYSEIEKNGEVASRITDVSASTRPVGFMEFSGAYKLREQLGEEDLDSVNLALLLDTGNLLKFTGAYTTNPEDSRGVVQRANSQSVGLKSDLGRLKLKGSVTQKEEYLAGKRSQLTEVGVDYRLSANSQLTTSYSLDEQEEASALQTSIYTLGYTHKVASRLHIYLGGKMTTYERDQMSLRDMEELQAEARIGIKF